MAIACSGERAPCSPSRICSISSRTNSPACVEGDLPSRSSSCARSIGSSSGIPKIVSPLATLLDVTKTVVGRSHLRFLQLRDANFADHASTNARAKKKFAIPQRARIGSARAHNSNNYSDYSVTRRSADLAVQRRLGLLPKRRIRTCSVDCSDPLANGTALNRARSLNRGKQFGLNQLFLAASRSFLIRSCVFLISEY